MWMRVIVLLKKEPAKLQVVFKLKRMHVQMHVCNCGCVISMLWSAVAHAQQASSYCSTTNATSILRLLVMTYLMPSPETPACQVIAVKPNLTDQVKQAALPDPLSQRCEISLHGFADAHDASGRDGKVLIGNLVSWYNY